MLDVILAASELSLRSLTEIKLTAVTGGEKVPRALTGKIDTFQLSIDIAP